jgi:hypothetical protein
MMDSNADADAREHFRDDDMTDIVVADSFSIDFCQHGYGQISLFHDGEKRPFAVVHFGPDATFDMAGFFAIAAKCEGSA